MLGYVRLYWPRPYGFYLAPFSEECLGILNISISGMGYSYSVFAFECIRIHIFEYSHSHSHSWILFDKYSHSYSNTIEMYSHS